MSTKHWRASYGSIPYEINPNAYCSVVDVMDQAMKRFADRPAMRCHATFGSTRRDDIVNRLPNT